MNIQEFTGGRERLFVEPRVNMVEGTYHVGQELARIINGTRLASITLARTAELDAVLLTTSLDEVVGLFSRPDGFVAVDGKVSDGTGKKHFQIAFREDPRPWTFQVPRAEPSAGYREVIGQDRNETSADQRFEDEVIGALPPIKSIEASIWEEAWLEVRAEDYGLVKVRMESDGLLGFFAASADRKVLLATEKGTTPVKVDLGAATTIPSEFRIL
jgi:hypothetical protein